MICGPRGSKSRLAKAAGAEPSGQMRDEKLHAVVERMTKKCAPLWREANFEVKTYKTHHSQTLLQVEMLKKCMPLWHEAHFEVNMYKTHHIQTNFGS